jgi:hypothetical protein
MEIVIKHKSKGEHIMLIDEDDYDKIKDLNITLNHTSNPNTYYGKSIVYKLEKILDEPEVMTTGKTRRKVYKRDKTINIHRLIMGLDDYKNDKRVVHHKDGNGLNNQKSNLEICSTMYNSQSCRSKRAQGIIYYDNSMNRIKRWRAVITIMGKKNQKRFQEKIEAEAWLKSIAPDKEIL